MCFICGNGQPDRMLRELRSGQVVCSGCVSALELALRNCEAALTEAKTARPPLNAWNYFSFAVVAAGIITAIFVTALLRDSFGVPAFFGVLAVTLRGFGACGTKASDYNRPLLDALQAKVRQGEEDLGHAVARLASLYEQYWDEPPDWNERRSLVVHRADGRCEQCGRRKTGSRVPFHVHHIVPRARAEGHHALSNLKLLCEICHGKQPEPGHRRIAAARARRRRRGW